MSAGRIEQDGTPEDVYDRPATPFVFDFIGESVRLDIRVDKGRPFVGQQEVSIPRLPPLLFEGPARLYIRPEHVAFRRDGEGLWATVVSLHRSGSSRRVGFRADGTDTVIEALTPADREPPRIGDRAALEIRAAGLFSG